MCQGEIHPQMFDIYFLSVMITLQKARNMIPLKKPEMQGAKFFRNETYLAYVAVSGELKQRRRLGFSAANSNRQQFAV
jgi:hypothetical protein